MKKIEKILKHIEDHGISIASFEKTAGLGSSYITKTRDRGVDITDKVLEKMKKNLKEEYYNIFPEERLLTESDVQEENKDEQVKDYTKHRRDLKLNSSNSKEMESAEEGVPIYDVPIDASFIERYRDEYYRPLYHINIPKLRNCNFGAIVTGSSMYPLMKSGSIAMCRIVEDFTYFDPGEMYFISTVNGFETVKYVQPADNPEELLLIPHNDKIKSRTIPIKMIVKMCIVEAWINFR